jgi:8-oxo-dGTP pyrophosphatase MutT (NUDIX family)
VLRATWDGLPVSEERPFGATVAVWRRNDGDIEWLLLHRKHHGPEYQGDWAWTPPAGARLPGEPLDECARRELLEETGLDLDFEPTGCGGDDWVVYVAEAPAGAAVELSPEHDRFEWLSLGEASARCLPAVVAAGLECAASTVVSS